MPPKKKRIDEADYGINRQGNDFRFSSIEPYYAFNQKNAYAEYLKRDEQFLSYRSDREEAEAKAAAKAATSVEGDPPELDDEDTNITAGNERLGAKTIVVHPGSRNLRLGLANAAFPKTVPMVIARLLPGHQGRVMNGREPEPKRMKLDGGEGAFGDCFETEIAPIEASFRARMRLLKLRTVPQGHELAASYNRRMQQTPPEKIPEHNDPYRIDWTDTTASPKRVCGLPALRLKDDRYKLFWPIQYGMLNESDYNSREELMGDMHAILQDALDSELGIKAADYGDYSVCLVVPDLYEKSYNDVFFRLLMTDFGFSRIMVQQESLCGSFGAGMSTSVVVDIGAQTTSIACVDDGFVIPDSRILMKYGGDDITLLWTKLLLRSSLPYHAVDIRRMHDWLLVEELKARFCTMNESDVNIRLHDFYLRSPTEPQTLKYTLKLYDEYIFAPMSIYHPQVYEQGDKFKGRYTLISRSEDIYDESLNDPESVAQNNLLPKVEGSNVATLPAPELLAVDDAVPKNTRPDVNNASLAPALIEDSSTPRPSTAPSPPQSTEARHPSSTYPITPLDAAIVESIRLGAAQSEDRLKRLYGSILVVGGGAGFPGFATHLEDRLRMLRPDLAGPQQIAVIPPPREMDATHLCWKGAAVVSKLLSAREYWVRKQEWELLGWRALAQRTVWQY
ncbi:actin-like ATPase domain-containing protein [Saitoella complicata NRRL Y-17804]|uniref:Uncharacterized protein n=1 Tax=Saitoella complicata (strain BCRC 22490 / CBS 7301 / JCM 7358 / NBRC 10748 / NRRL Y-17804) TaxID=698492 RepID=A0A0E9NB89_SAICN|nr:actin-like ATPase domain-containing protein [Saitoella complicata NRRL Y-17804]ODQ53839.1 actin-like ATPase domain-containing protein [Saitoella complicata NRRL Y-17804]GAO46956.1 hypothetical protein G7K_1173-t1 [Saitoella complicata NRRL Y-17804]